MRLAFHFRSACAVAACCAFAACVGDARAQTIDAAPDAGTVLVFSGNEGGPFFAEGGTSWDVFDADEVGLSFRAESNQLWAEVSPVTGDLPCVIDCSEEVSVSIVPVVADRLAPGVYTATISFIDQADATNVAARTVRLNVAPASFSVSPAIVSVSAVEGGANPAPATVTLTSNGDVDLNYRLSWVQRNWFNITKTTGTVPAGGNDSFDVVFFAGGVDVGTVSAQLTITNTTNGAGTVEIPIALTVRSAGSGAVSLAPDVDLFASGPEGEIALGLPVGATLRNDSDRAVLWSAKSDAEWVSVSPAGGELAVGGSGAASSEFVTMRINVAADALPAGSHVATITFDNETTNVPIATRSARVLARPILSTNAPDYRGSVSLLPGSDEPVDGDGARFAYDLGTVVVMTANPTPGNEFTGWTSSENLDDPEANPLVVTMDASRTVAAGFAPLLRSLTLSVSGSGTGTITQSPQGDEVDGSFVSRFADGTTVTLTAEPDGGTVFAEWQGNVPAGSEKDSAIDVLLDRDRVVTARFEEAVSLDVFTEGDGAVTVSPQKDAYARGEVVTLTAVPTEPNVLLNWSGGASGSSSPLTLTLSGDTSVTAVFGMPGDGPDDPTPGDDQVQLTVNITGGGLVTPSGGLFDPGTVVTLIATPDVGGSFVRWDGDASGTGLTTSVTMSEDLTVEAIFTGDPDAGQDPGSPTTPSLCGAAGVICFPLMMLGMMSMRWTRRSPQATS